MSFSRWSPHVTVAALIEQEGRFLLVEERCPDGLRLNNPAGHLEEGESLVEACAREVLEESGYAFTATGLVGVYLSRFHPPHSSEAISYLRFAFCGVLGATAPGRTLDPAIERTLWMSAEEIAGSRERHRTPLLWQCVQDYLAGHRTGLQLLHTSKLC